MARWIMLGSLFASGLIVGSFLNLGPTPIIHADEAPPLPATPGFLEPDRPAAAYHEPFTEVIRKVAPSVVSVDARKPVTTGLLRPRTKTTEESGSGVIVRFDGIDGHYVITNNHVVGGAVVTDITVTLADARIIRPTRMWTDPPSDVAVLQMPKLECTSLEFADSDRLQLGQWVLAFGSPFGLHQTVTHGIISARDRGQINLGDTIRIKDFIQTDAAINPGSSGGALVDLHGRLVGINTAIASNNGNNSGVSFSIPSNLVLRVSKELLTAGRVSRGYLGMQLAPTLEPTTALNLGLDRALGTLVDSVAPGGPADQAGVKPGDVILKLGDVVIRNENHLINLVGNLPVGQQMKMSLWRNRQTRSTEVTIRSWAEATGQKR